MRSAQLGRVKTFEEKVRAKRGGVKTMQTGQAMRGVFRMMMGEMRRYYRWLTRLVECRGGRENERPGSHCFA